MIITIIIIIGDYNNVKLIVMVYKTLCTVFRNILYNTKTTF